MKKVSVVAVGLIGITTLAAHIVTGSGTEASQPASGIVLTQTAQESETSSKAENQASKPESESATASATPTPTPTPTPPVPPGASGSQPGGMAASGVNQVYVELAQAVVPSVVNISTVTARTQGPTTQEEEFFRRFFEEFFGPGGPMPGMPRGGRPAMSLGTGFVIDADGLILTNNHVVAGAEEITVSFQSTPENGLPNETPAEVVGRDPELDIALIRVKTDRKLQSLPFGDSESLQVGEYVAAVGNPFGQGHSITHGIISAKGRLSPDMPLVSYLQTDAPINPGNSGGPLVNLEGKVIGVNNAILAQAQGIGFAIPVNLIKDVLPQLKTKGVVTRGYIGVLINEMTPEIASQLKVEKDESSPFITHVYPNSPAERAGIQPYDVIQQFAGQPVESGSDLLRAVTDVPVGSNAKVIVSRDGKKRELEIKVTERPTAPALAERDRPGQGGQPSGEEQADPTQSGLTVDNLNPALAARLGLPADTAGVVVTGVEPGTPADQAGLVPGDVILDVDQKTVESVKDFRTAIRERESHLLRIRRPTPGGEAAVAVVVLDLKSVS